MNTFSFCKCILNTHIEDSVISSYAIQNGLQGQIGGCSCCENGCRGVFIYDYGSIYIYYHFC